MSLLGLAVPPGFTISTEVCGYYYQHDRRYPDGLADQVKAALGQIEAGVEARLRRPGAAALGLGPLRRALVDAGHDGHGAEPRPERPHRRGSRRDRAAALRLRQLSPLHPDVRRRRPRRRSLPVRGPARRAQAPERLPARHRSRDRGPRASDRVLPGDRAEADRRAVPAGRRAAALGCDRRGLRLLDDAACGHLPAPARHRRDHGHCRHRAGHGVRQPRRQQRYRGGVHARPVDRRQALLRRVPGQRAGRGRGRRHPHAAAADARDEAGDQREAAGDGRGDAARPMPSSSRCSNSSRRTIATCRTSSSRSRKAGSGSCRRGTASGPPTPRSRSRSTWPPRA